MKVLYQTALLLTSSALCAPFFESEIGVLKDHINYKDGQCQVIDKEWHITNIDASSEELCLAESTKLVEKPFLDIQKMIDDAQSDYPDLKEMVESTIGECITETGAILAQPIESRVKKFASLKQKFFDRISGAQRHGKDFVYHFNMNDLIAFRVLMRSSEHTTALAECLKMKADKMNLDAKSLRSRDGRTYYASGLLPTQESHYGYPGNYEIQIWPFSEGSFMAWRHDVYYKPTGKDITSSMKPFKKTWDDFSQCMAIPAFYDLVLPQHATAESLQQWLMTECREFAAKNALTLESHHFHFDPPASLAEEYPEKEPLNLHGRIHEKFFSARDL
jgi:hypothetical protein